MSFRGETIMATFVEMDERSTLSAQMEQEVAPVILINTFTVNADEAPQLLNAWAADAAWMRQQPGFISTQLHRGIAGSCVFLNYAVWESTEHFKRAFTHPEFRSHLAHYPASTRVSPHLFQKVAVPGICVA
jgi:heme-degrading monooxygenase HmoA